MTGRKHGGLWSHTVCTWEVKLNEGWYYSVFFILYVQSRTPARRMVSLRVMVVLSTSIGPNLETPSKICLESCHIDNFNSC